jgi:hypothetical protein
MNPLHPATTPLLAALCLAGRMILERVDPAAGEAWQRGIEVLSGAAAVGVFMKFSPGDPPRRPWALLMATMVLIVASRVVGHLDLMIGDIKLAHLIIILCNLCIAAAIIAFNRLLGSSELLSERTEADRWRALTFVGLLALGAVAALGYNAWSVADRGIPDGPGAWIAAASTLVSTLCDVIVCTGAVYLVWLVRPLLGGSLARPYLLLAISAGMSLVVDFLLVAAGVAIQTELAFANFSTQLAKWLGCLAYALIGLAAATQLWLLRSAGRRQKSPSASMSMAGASRSGPRSEDP